MTRVERRFQDIYIIGCVACRMLGWFQPCQIHHLNLHGRAGQKRRGDQFTIGLCPWHHIGQTGGERKRKDMERIFGPSLALSSIKFRAKFGTDDQLLEYQNELIAEYRKRLVA